MSIKENEPDNDIDIFGTIEEDNQFINKRIAVRYIREDISASITKTGFFCSSKSYPVKLLDISSKGVAVECRAKLTVTKKIILTFIFQDNEKFIIPAKIIYRSQINKNIYGIKFNHYNHKLGDHLLSSQSDLVFK